MVNNLVAALLDGLFPAYCALCGLRSWSSLPLCCGCRNELQPNSSSCYRCAIPLPPLAQDVTDGRLCGKCLRATPPFERVIAPWIYCERLAHLIQRWKFHGHTHLTPLLASLWLQGADQPPAVDLIVPVPLHWRRQWRRGFNQSELLARQLRAAAPSPVPIAMDHRSVRRRATRAQSSMNATQRAANLRGAFTVYRRYDNLRIAIIDDVLTTGATATSMAAALRSAGAGRVEVWCLARTPAPGA